MSWLLIVITVTNATVTVAPVQRVATKAACLSLADDAKLGVDFAMKSARKFGVQPGASVTFRCSPVQGAIS